MKTDPRRVILALVLAVVGVACRGADTNNNEPFPVVAEAVFRGNPEHSGEYGSKAIHDSPTVRWKFETSGVTTDPVIANGLVLFGAGGWGVPGYLHALDAGTGEERWKLEMDAATFSTPAVVGNLVLLGGRDKSFYGLDLQTGQVRWQLDVGAAVDTSPAVAGDIVYFGSDDHLLHAVEYETGQESWSFKTQHPVKSSPTVVDGVIYFGSNDGWFYAVDTATQEERWRFQTERNVASTPAVVDGAVYFSSNGDDDPLYALDSATGSELWRKGQWRQGTKGNMLSPAVSSGVLYFGVQEGNLYAIDLKTLDQLWSFPTRASSDPAIAGDMLYLVSYDGYLHAVETGSGQERWRFLLGSPWGTSPAIANGVVFVGSEKGMFYALEQSAAVN